MGLHCDHAGAKVLQESSRTHQSTWLWNRKAKPTACIADWRDKAQLDWNDLECKLRANHLCSAVLNLVGESVSLFLPCCCLLKPDGEAAEFDPRPVLVTVSLSKSSEQVLGGRPGRTVSASAPARSGEMFCSAQCCWQQGWRANYQNPHGWEIGSQLAKAYEYVQCTALVESTLSGGRPISWWWVTHDDFPDKWWLEASVMSYPGQSKVKRSGNTGILK